MARPRRSARSGAPVRCPFRCAAGIRPGGGADAAKLAAGQRRLEHVAGVHRTLGRARADHGVQLIDKQDDLALRLLHFFDGRLQPLLELAAEAGAGDHRAEVQAHQALARQDFGHVVRDDLLRQSFDDGGLAHARIADEHRVIFGAPAEHLNHAQDLRIAADDRVELALARRRGQITGVALQGAITAFRARGCWPSGRRGHLPSPSGSSRA